MKRNKKAFTLIELLVVVLIIGILAAVALPQYQKAVKKSRMTEYMTYITNYYKALDSWLLQNGTPSALVRFTGEQPTGILEIDMPCEKNEDIYCFTKIGRFNVACNPDHCWADLGTSYTGYKGFFDKGSSIETGKYYSGEHANQIILDKAPTPKADRKIFCETWATYFGRQQMSVTASASCAEVGV